MVEPVRHRQTKGAETDMFEPKATASHLDSTLFGHAAMSDLSPVCAQKRTSASRAAVLKAPNLLKEILSRVGVPGGPSIKLGGLVKVSQAAALNRSKRKASRSRSGRSSV